MTLCSPPGTNGLPSGDNRRQASGHPGWANIRLGTETLCCILARMNTRQTAPLDMLFPFAGNHAIESVAVVLAWDGQRDERLNAQFISWQSDLSKQGYGPANPINAMEVFFNSSNIQNNTSSVLAGYSFVKGQSGVPRREIVLRDTQFIFTVRDYSRWAAFIADVETLLEKLIPLLESHGKKIVSVSLQYQDKFTWKDFDAPFPTRHALRDAGFVPMGIMEKSPQWHSNQGFFVGEANEGLGRRLDNINLSLTIEGAFPILGLLIVHQYGPRESNWDTFTRANVKEILQTSHAANKDYVSQLLSEDLCKKISLGDV